MITSDDETPVTITHPCRPVILSSKLKDTNNDATSKLASHRTTTSAIGQPSVLPVTITASKTGTKCIADDTEQSVNSISDTDHTDDKGLAKKLAPKVKSLQRMDDAHTSTFQDDNQMIALGHSTRSVPVPLNTSNHSSAAGYGMPSSAPPQSTRCSVTSINPNRGTSSVLTCAASVTTILDDNSAANGATDTRSLGGGASDFNDKGDEDDGKNDEPTQEAINKDGFLVDIQVH
ncbi:hypothetical protein BDN67DRAFT_1017554 [Paxillus ammoniavirescens]|nr:hypothetical protein BDN67DRAFT_1017554 [Paxillus ammoniavirescens]